MAKTAEPISEFLRGKRIAVAGVSRSGASAANPVFRKLRDCGYDAVPVNPNAAEVEGARCYPDLASVPGDLDGVIDLYADDAVQVMPDGRFEGREAVRERLAQ